MNNTGHKCLILAIVLGSHSSTSRSWHVLTSSRLDKKKAWLFLLGPKRALLEHRLTGKRDKKHKTKFIPWARNFCALCAEFQYSDRHIFCVLSRVNLKNLRLLLIQNGRWDVWTWAEQSNLAPPRPAKPFYHSINCGDGGAKKSMHARYLGEFAHKPVPSKYWKRYAFS